MSKKRVSKETIAESRRPAASGVAMLFCLVPFAVALWHDGTGE